MKPEELEEIRKRAEAATPGPWYRLFEYGINIVTESDYKVIDEDGGVSKYPDAEFIVKSREDVPKLLAEIERLKREKSRLINELMKADERLVHTLMPFIK